MIQIFTKILLQTDSPHATQMGGSTRVHSSPVLSEDRFDRSTFLLLSLVNARASLTRHSLLKDGEKNQPKTNIQTRVSSVHQLKKAAATLLPGRQQDPSSKPDASWHSLDAREWITSLQQKLIFVLCLPTSFPGSQQTPSLCPRILSFSRKPHLCAAYSQNQHKCPMNFLKCLLYYNFLAQRPPILRLVNFYSV